MKVERVPPKVFQWRVKSNSIKGKYYIVSTDGFKWHCNCTAGKMGRECRHVRKVKNNFKGLKYNRQ